MSGPRAEAIDAKIGARIKARRKQLDVSQAGLGRKVGVSFQQIQKYESGNSRIAASRLLAVAKALGVPVQELFP